MPIFNDDSRKQCWELRGQAEQLANRVYSLLNKDPSQQELWNKLRRTANDFVLLSMSDATDEVRLTKLDTLQKKLKKLESEARIAVFLNP